MDNKYNSIYVDLITGDEYLLDNAVNSAMALVKYIQSQEDYIWTINHNKNSDKFIIQIDDGQTVADVKILDANNVQLTFDTPKIGKAILIFFDHNIVIPSPTPTQTITPSVTPSVSITPSVTQSITPSVTATPSVTITPTITPTLTPTLTPTITPTASAATTATTYTWKNVFTTGSLRVRLWSNNYNTQTPDYDGTLSPNSSVTVINSSVPPSNTTHLTLSIDASGVISISSSDHAFGNSGYGAICTVDLPAASETNVRLTSITKNTDAAFNHQYDLLTATYDGNYGASVFSGSTYTLGSVPTTDFGLSVNYPAYTGGGTLGSLPFFLMSFAVEIYSP